MSFKRNDISRFERLLTSLSRKSILAFFSPVSTHIRSLEEGLGKAAFGKHTKAANFHFSRDEFTFPEAFRIRRGSSFIIGALPPLHSSSPHQIDADSLSAIRHTTIRAKEREQKGFVPARWKLFRNPFLIVREIVGINNY